MPITPEQATWFAESFNRLVANVDQAIVGKQLQIRLVLTALLSSGHGLREYVPCTGKTVLDKAFAPQPLDELNNPD